MKSCIFFVRIFCFLLLSLTLSPNLFATSNRPDAHAPISVMGDHKHHKGEWMFSYRYMHMDMDGNMDGNNNLSAAEILDPNGLNFLVTPLEMQMDMHMFGDRSRRYCPASQ